MRFTTVEILSSNFEQEYMRALNESIKDINTFKELLTLLSELYD